MRDMKKTKGEFAREWMNLGSELFITNRRFRG